MDRTEPKLSWRQRCIRSGASPRWPPWRVSPSRRRHTLAQAQISDAQRGEIERIIKDYLLRNPEVLQEAIAELDKKQAAVEAEKHKAAVKEQCQASVRLDRAR